MGYRGAVDDGGSILKPTNGRVTPPRADDGAADDERSINELESAEQGKPDREEEGELLSPNGDFGEDAPIDDLPINDENTSNGAHAHEAAAVGNEVGPDEQREETRLGSDVHQPSVLLIQQAQRRLMTRVPDNARYFRMNSAISTKNKAMYIGVGTLVVTMALRIIIEHIIG